MHLQAKGFGKFAILRLIGWTCIAFCLSLGRPIFHLVNAIFQDKHDRPPVARERVNDASHFNDTAVKAVLDVPGSMAEAEDFLRKILVRAQTEKTHVSLGGARHTMGGQTILDDSLHVNMLPLNAVSLSENHEVLHAEAGARWSQILPFLDRHGRSIEVMQSNNTFTIGGSISANCHGWQFDKPPIAASVISLRLMLADGSIQRCSMDENKELFKLVLGGYGLFGIILDVEFKTIPNQLLSRKSVVVPTSRALAAFDQLIGEQDNVRMAYARMSIAPTSLFDEVMITTYIEKENEPIPPLTDWVETPFSRVVFRGSVGSDYGKKVRWQAETKLDDFLGSDLTTRNQLLNEPSEWFLSASAARTDILHEYFVPRNHSSAFLAQVKSIILRHQADLTNITVREVDTDQVSFLRYADGPMFCFVMLFNQEIGPAAERDMAEITRELIDSALDHHGRYYLPYRLHATDEQLRRAYPHFGQFVERKRHYDPQEIFSNQFWQKYSR